MAATDELASWEALARRGSKAETALAAYARSHTRAEAALLEARYQQREAFVYERALLTMEVEAKAEPTPSLSPPWKAWYARWLAVVTDLSSIGVAEQKRLHVLINARWRDLVERCDAATHMPALLGDLWATPDGLDMRAFLRAKSAVASMFGASSPAAVARRLRANDRVVEAGCVALSNLARATRTERGWLPPRDWWLDGKSLYNRDGYTPVNDQIAETLVKDFLLLQGWHSTDHLWKMRTFVDPSDIEGPTRAESGDFDVIEFAPPTLVRDAGRVLERAPRPALCPPNADLRRLALYHSDDDQGGCLPTTLFHRLRAAAYDGEKDRARWWSRAKLDREMRACKLSKPTRAVLVQLWTEVDPVIARPYRDLARSGDVLIAASRAERAMGERSEPEVPLECAPADLAIWLAKAAYDALPTKDKLTTLDDWVSKDELQRAVDRCDLATDEAVLTRMLWSDLDAIVQSSAARTTKEAAMKDALHAYRYDRPPWAVAQRRAARALIDESLRKL